MKENFFITLLLFSCCPIWFSATPWTVAHQAPPYFAISQSLLKFLSTESVMLSNNLILCSPLLLLPSVFSPGFFPMSQLFASRSQSIGPSTSVSMNINSNEYSGLIYFTIYWFDLLAVQGTQESYPVPQLKASILRHPAFFFL